MKEIKNGVIIQGKAYEVRESDERYDVCAFCDMKHFRDNLCAEFCRNFEKYLRCYAVYFRDATDMKDLRLLADAVIIGGKKHETVVVEGQRICKGCSMMKEFDGTMECEELCCAFDEVYLFKNLKKPEKHVRFAE